MLSRGRYWFGNLVAVVIVGLIFPAQAQSTSSSQAQLRAVWASTLSPCMNSPQEIRDLVAAVRRAYLNCIIAQVRHRGMTFYRSKIEPPAASWAQQKDFDPLATLLAQAHEITSGSQRLDVYAWFNVFNFGNEETTSLTAEQRQRIRAWFSRTTTGSLTHFLDPAIPEVQEYLLSIIRECVENYPVDGVNLDFIRYPEEEAGYHPTAIARFQKLYHRQDTPTPTDPQWNEFRREQVSGFVRRCAAEVWSIRPDAMVTVCAVGFGGAPPNDDFTRSSPYRQVHQDWARWAREGYVDVVTRMGYKCEHVPAHAQQFRDWADYSVRLWKQCPGNMITLGIGGFLNSAENTLVQYREAQRRGLGTSLFSYWRPERDADKTKLFGSANPLWDRIGSEIYPTLVPPPRPDWRKNRVTIAVKCVAKSNGQAVDGASVELNGPVSSSERSDGNGWAIFPALPLGRYELVVKAPGIRQSVDATKPGVQKLELRFP